MFDLRVSFDKNNVPEFRHGLIAYKGDVEKTLHYLNSKRVAVRLVLEEYYDDKDNRQEELFKYYCTR